MSKPPRDDAGPASPGRVWIGAVPVSRVDYESAAALVVRWARAGEGRYLCACSAHGVVEADRDPSFGEVLAAADAVVPDGVPLVWTMRALGATEQARVYGPELMLHVCAACAEEGLPVFLYGTTPETLSRLSAQLAERFPGLAIAGTHSPPFRPLTPEEDAQVVEEIRDSGARVLFVGLSTPKQDRWMHSHRGVLSIPMLGVGAAFDFHAGLLRQAPSWMQRAGLEWFFRLLVEPKRLWRRYVVVVPRYLWVAFREVLGGRGLRPRSRPASHDHL